jgi:hypothetical protein
MVGIVNGAADEQVTDDRDLIFVVGAISVTASEQGQRPARR